MYVLSNEALLEFADLEYGWMLTIFVDDESECSVIQATGDTNIVSRK